MILGIAITWLGLALAYFLELPVGFYITTIAFTVYVIARVARALIERPTWLHGRRRRAIQPAGG